MKLWLYSICVYQRKLHIVTIMDCMMSKCTHTHIRHSASIRYNGSVLEMFINKCGTARCHRSQATLYATYRNSTLAWLRSTTYCMSIALHRLKRFQILPLARAAWIFKRGESCMTTMADQLPSKTWNRLAQQKHLHWKIVVGNHLFIQSCMCSSKTCKPCSACICTANRFG